MAHDPGVASFIRVLGSRVHMVEIPDAVSIMDGWIQSGEQICRLVVNTGMHGIMEAHRHPEFKSILNSADLFCPDGILMVLIARARGYAIRKRFTGPELLWEFCRSTQQRNYRHFFYGDTQETLNELAHTLKTALSGVDIVGLHSPPFRALTPAEDQAITQQINAARPDVLWVGLGAPKQERWMFEHRNKLDVPVVVGAGAAFKFSSGQMRRAPRWLQDAGLEWLWRLVREPQRVGRRVLIDAPQFMGLAALELTGLKKFS